jgi:valyl-tRNA synthetase
MEAKKAAKTAKATVANVAGEKQAVKAKEKKKDEETPFVNTTPKGHKKGTVDHPNV